MSANQWDKNSRNSHLTTEMVIREYGVPFNKIADTSLANVFFRWLGRSPYSAPGGTILASINPVTPHHVFLIPTPSSVGARKNNDGQWEGLPADSYLNCFDEQHRLAFAGAFFDWVSIKHREISSLNPTIKVTTSYMTANEGPMSSRAVLYPHFHDLILLADKDYEDPSVKALKDVDRFCRLPKGDILGLLRTADQEHLKKIEKQTAEFIPFSIPQNLVKEAAREGIAIEFRRATEAVRPVSVKTTTKYNPEFVASGFTSGQFRALEKYAGLVKRKFLSQGADGFTVVMDTTALRNPQAVVDRVDMRGNILLSYEVIPHPPAVPFVKGGLVYALQNATAPAFIPN